MQGDKPSLSALIERAPHSHDYLSFAQIEEQYPGTVKVGTLRVWACTRRYGFHEIVTKVGSRSRVRRDLWERFLEQRTVGNSLAVAA